MKCAITSALMSGMSVSLELLGWLVTGFFWVFKKPSHWFRPSEKATKPVVVISACVKDALWNVTNQNSFTAHQHDTG